MEDFRFPTSCAFCSKGADMEDLIMGDILVGKANISLANTPKEWITNLHKATLGKRYIASEARILNETE